MSGGDGAALRHRDAATQPRLDCYSATIRRHHCQDREKILTTYLINDKNWRVLACLCPPYIQHRRGHQIFFIFVKFLHWSQYQVDTRTHYRVHVIASGYRWRKDMSGGSGLRRCGGNLAAHARQPLVLDATLWFASKSQSLSGKVCMIILKHELK